LQPALSRHNDFPDVQVMAKIIGFPTRAAGLGPHDRAPLRELAQRLSGTWRCETRVNRHGGVELALIPEEWGDGVAAAFSVLRGDAGFVLYDWRRSQQFGGATGPEHLGTYADTRDIALVIADLVGTRRVTLPTARDLGIMRPRESG
jgi:hypothetical protein